MLIENFLRSYLFLVETGILAAAKGVEITESQKKKKKKTIADQKLKDLKIKNYLFQPID